MQTGNQSTPSASVSRTEFGERLFQALSTVPAVDGLSEDNLEVVYGLAYRHAAQRQFHLAAPIFRLLIQLSPITQAYWRGLALCNQMLDRNDDAIALYELLIVMFGPSEQVQLRIAECHIAEHRRGEALAALAPLVQGNISVSPDVQLRARTLTSLLSKET